MFIELLFKNSLWSQWDNGPLSIPHPLKKDFQAKHLSFFLQGTSGGFRGLFINYAAYHHAGQYECIAQTTITQTSVATEVKVRGNVRVYIANELELLTLCGTKTITLLTRELCMFVRYRSAD